VRAMSTETRPRQKKAAFFAFSQTREDHEDPHSSRLGAIFAVELTKKREKNPHFVLSARRQLFAQTPRRLVN